MEFFQATPGRPYVTISSVEEPGFALACQTLRGTNSGPGDFVQSSTFQSEGSRDTKLVLRYHERLAPFPVQLASEKMAVMSNV